jgi:hypothetical protein
MLMLINESIKISRKPIMMRSAKTLMWLTRLGFRAGGPATATAAYSAEIPAASTSTAAGSFGS